MKLIRSEPAVFVGLIGAIIALGVSFGLKLSADEIGAIMAVVSAGLAFVTRSQVSPVAGLPAPVVPDPPVALPTP